jgi:EKC/KEOPS complex subunit CGI121/TPRKB
MAAAVDVAMELHISFELFPTHRLVVLAFAEVENSNELLHELTSGRLGQLTALLDREKTLDESALAIAANRVLYRQSRNSLRTRGCATELTLLLAASRNITQALRTFGISAETKNLLVASFNPDKTHLEQLRTLIRGRQVSPTFSQPVNMSVFSQLYGLTAAEVASRSLSSIVATKIATFDLES